MLADMKLSAASDIHKVDNLEIVMAAAKAACNLVAPMWSLDSFVAVNPFWGLREKSIVTADRTLQTAFGSGVFLDREAMRRLHRQRPFSAVEIEHAAVQVAEHCAGADLEVVQRAAYSVLNDAELAANPTLRAYVDFVSSNHDPRLKELIVNEISRFMALYFDRGQAVWRYPFQSLQLFDAWRKFVEIDLSLEVYGISKAREFFCQLPESYCEVLVKYSSEISLSNKLKECFVAELALVKGWAAYAQHLEFEAAKRKETTDLVPQILAVVCGYALLVKERYGSASNDAEWRELIGGIDIEAQDKESIGRAVLQQVLDARYVAELQSKLGEIKVEASNERPKLQAIFCIDVRSEGFRRALEAADAGIQTYGFAGFFGLPLKLHPRGGSVPVSQYPVLLSSTFDVCEVHLDSESPLKNLILGVRRRIKSLIKTLRQSVSSGFSFVEAFGAWYGASMLMRSLNPPAAKTCGHELARAALAISLDPNQRIAAARAILKNTSLKMPLAPVVLLVGHGSQTDNNPYAAGLDCGACGGHSGDANSRVAARLLNDPEVRKALAIEGVEIPTDTVFLAARHNTTLDDVTILHESSETVRGPLMRQVEGWLASAGGAARSERQAALVSTDSNGASEADVFRRARDWSEVRPEWGLARNAAFIAARRIRTRGAELSNRTFLHEYDYSRDSDLAILELIMTAPMVVASWINLQYLGSTASPNVFGSSTKVIHNVVGQLGVVLGNGGDLQVGLPLQSVHTGKERFHEPLRLNVIIEAPAESIQSIIKKHKLLQELSANGWLHIYSLEREAPRLSRVN